MDTGGGHAPRRGGARGARGGAVRVGASLRGARRIGSRGSYSLYSPMGSRGHFRPRRAGTGGGAAAAAATDPGEVQMGDGAPAADTGSAGPVRLQRRSARKMGDAMQQSGQRGGRGGGASGAPGRADARSAVPWRVQVQGAEHEPQDQILQFLGAAHPFTYTHAKKDEHGALIITVGSKADAYNLAHATGIQYHGRKLKIRILKRDAGAGGGGLPGLGSGDPLAALDQAEVQMTDGPASWIHVLDGYVQRMITPDRRFADLSALASRAELSTVRIDMNNPRFVNTMLRLVQRHAPSVESLSLARNGMESLAALEQLRTILPACENLDLSGNHLRHENELAHLKNVRPRELVIKDNPWTVDEKHAGDVPLTVRRYLPDLQMLNLVPLPKLISFGLDTTTHALPPAAPLFADSEANRGLAQAFVKRFLHFYDSDRNALYDLYAADAAFSMHFTPPPAPKGQAPRGPAPKELKAYLALSRNMMRCQGSEDRARLLFRTNVKILHAFSELPRTNHAADYAVEVCMLPPGSGAVPLLMVVFHGSFAELTETGQVQRSYDRCLLLTPPVPGSRAEMAQWPATVLNDSLHVRPYMTPTYGADTPAAAMAAISAAAAAPASPFGIGAGAIGSVPAVSPQPTMNIHAVIGGGVGVGGFAQPLAAGAAPYPMPSGLTPEQQQMVMTVSQMTRLKPDWAHQLLVNNLWNYDIAMKGFEVLRSKNEVPAHAYM